MGTVFIRRHGGAKAARPTATRPVAQFYLDTRTRTLHCLNDTARQLVRDGIPIAAADLEKQPLQHLDGTAVTAADLPLQRAWREETPCEATLVLSRPDGTVRHLQWTASPLLEKEGRVFGVFGSLTAASPEPDWQVLAGLAHDLRTPLQTLRLLAPVLQALPDLPESLREPLRRVQASAERSLSVGMDLLEWCRAPARSGRPVERKWMNLVPLLGALASEQVPIAERKRIVLETELGAAEGLEICCDAVRLGRLLSNLLANAVRYTEAGRVRFAAAWRCDQTGQREAFAIKVLDTGTGLSSEEQDCLFQPFERGKAGRESDSGGSGVGLSVVDRLVEEMGLALEVYSEYGRGSSFDLIVPLNMVRSTSSSSSPSK
jgi:signal transduction histidine kinase